MRKTALKSLLELAKKNKNVIFIGSDLGSGTLNEFKEKFPERYFMEGISEQHIIGMASGLALDGYTVYINTISTFLTRRCFEQNVVNLGLHNLNVRLIGSGGGTVYAPLGPTHIALDDIAIMNTIPNMTIISVADEVEMANMMRETLKHKGPIYIRMGKGGDPIITKRKKFKIGSCYKYLKGDEVALISTGIMTFQCINAAKKLNKNRIKTSVYHFPTIKPFNVRSIINATRNKKIVLVVEEHSEIGGLHSIGSSNLMKNQIVTNYSNISFKDKFISSYGKQKDILNNNKLDEISIYKKIIKMLNQENYHEKRN